MDVGDYLRDTGHLTRAEHGSYLLSIMHYWSKGESLTTREFRSICGREFMTVREFYSQEGDRWHHKRIDRELEGAKKRMQVAQDKGRKGAEARWRQPRL